ncbi:PLP-dependent transferase [Wallemia mellicola]|nr:PLP-dependent transferase [Wallemia mellicola]
MSELNKRIEKVLKSRTERGLKRQLNDNLDRRQFNVDFSSNDYLSLAKNEKLIGIVKERLAKSDVMGSGGSRLLDGDTILHRQIERKLSNFYNGEDALLFNSGYDANVSIFATIPDKDDIVIYDELIHASVHDGMRGSRTTHCWSFRHSDLNHLSELLNVARKQHSGSIFIAVEAVYSMDGDLCPLEEIANLTKGDINTHLVVDEAHSTGHIGSNGRGLVSALNLDQYVAIKLNTFGKALCAAGAVVLCAPNVRNYLINYARPLIFSTSMTLSNLHIVDVVHDYLSDGHLTTEIDNLKRNATYLRQRLGIPENVTPIVPILTPQSKRLAKALQDNGILVRPITWPTVPKDKDRVRVCVHSHNTIEEIDKMVEIIEKFCTIRSKL